VTLRHYCLSAYECHCGAEQKSRYFRALYRRASPEDTSSCEIRAAYRQRIHNEFSDEPDSASGKDTARPKNREQMMVGFRVAHNIANISTMVTAKDAIPVLLPLSP
jgi:hypothetical protein